MDSPVQDVILSMMHGIWQQRSLSLIVGFKIPELLCNSDKPLCIDDIASATGCDSSEFLYPIMKVLAQWGIGEEVDNKHFVKNQGMELLRRDKGPSLGHLLWYYGSEELYTALSMIPESVRHGQAAFHLEHGMSHYSYMNDISTKPYEGKAKMMKGTSQYLVGTSERRKEFAENYVGAMASLSNLTLLPDCQGINNIYEAYPWSSCKKLVDVCGSTGHFISSIMKRPGCEHIQGFVIELPDVVDAAVKNVDDLGLSEGRITFIRHDIFKPLSSDIQADTVMIKNGLSSFSIDDQITMLKNCKSLFKDNGRLLVIEVYSQDKGDSEHNIGVNGLQIGFTNINSLLLCGTYSLSIKETRDIMEDACSKAGYKLNQVYNTFPGGYTLFELLTL